MLDWENAEKHLKECEQMYKSIGSSGQFVLSIIIIPLINRFKNNERTVELYDEIMEIES